MAAGYSDADRRGRRSGTGAVRENGYRTGGGAEAERTHRPKNASPAAPRAVVRPRGVGPISSGLPTVADRAHCWAMGTKSRETIYGSSIRASAERAKEARKQADRLACEAWNQRMLGYKGPAQPSPALGDALNAGYRISKSDVSAAIPTRPSPWISCDGRRARRSTSWSGTCGALRTTRISAIDPPSTWWPGER
jgi:hypothetical protein